MVSVASHSAWCLPPVFPARGESPGVLCLDGAVLLQHLSASGAVVLHCVTWNMHGKPPPDDLRPMLPSAHIYAVGSEECERSIARSLVQTGKETWEAHLASALGPEYVRLASHTLAAIHLAVFVHRALLPIISDVQTGAVPCGVGNALGNKGGVGVGFTLGKTSFLVINCHLAAHMRNVPRRNKDAQRIDALLPLFPAGMGGVEEAVQRLADEAAEAARAGGSSGSSAGSVATPAAVERGDAAGLSSCCSTESSEGGDALAPYLSVAGDEEEGGQEEEEEESGSVGLLAGGGAAPSSSPLLPPPTSRGSDAPAPLPLLAPPPPPPPDPSLASSRYDRVVWMGDMNYRVNGSRKAVDTLLATGAHEVLLANDQLLRERRGGRVFPSFSEGPLSFMPTYKLDKGGLTYDSGPKQRVPAWTDRILFKSNEVCVSPPIVRTGRYVYGGEGKGVGGLSHGPGPPPVLSLPTMALLDYAACESLRTSDHLPVTATFAVKLRGDHARRRSSVSGGATPTHHGGSGGGGHFKLSGEEALLRSGVEPLHTGSALTDAALFTLGRSTASSGTGSAPTTSRHSGGGGGGLPPSGRAALATGGSSGYATGPPPLSMAVSSVSSGGSEEGSRRGTPLPLHPPPAGEDPDTRRPVATPPPVGAVALYDAGAASKGGVMRPTPSSPVSVDAGCWSSGRPSAKVAPLPGGGPATTASPLPRRTKAVGASTAHACGVQ